MKHNIIYIDDELENLRAFKSVFRRVYNIFATDSPSEGIYDFDAATKGSVSLQTGSDAYPRLNYVFIRRATGLLETNNDAWPMDEFAAIATVMCQSAASLQTSGAYKVHAWTDHIDGSRDIGHIAHLNHWIRNQNATWVSSVQPTLSITTNAGALDSVTYLVSSGKVLQLHPHDFFVNSTTYYVPNDSTSPYRKVTNLNTILADSTGATMSSRYFSLVVWGVVNENVTDCKFMINLPGGSYGRESTLKKDTNKFANFDIPENFKGTGFLISQLNLRHQTTNGGTWTEVEIVDLRGLEPSIVAGGGTTGAVEFADNTFRIFDDARETSQIAFNANNISAGFTRTLSVQDSDGIIALSDVAHYGTGRTSVDAHNLLVGDTVNPLGLIVPTTTHGIPLVSKGWSADPAFDTAAVAGGGTGLTTIAAHNLLVGDGTNAVKSVAPHVLPGKPLVSFGTSADPDYGIAVVGGGGTGRSAHAENELIAGGTDSGSAQQSIPTGTAGHVLASNGSGTTPNLPSFKALTNPIKLTSYITSGSYTHTFESATNMVYVLMYGGGAGGGAGRRGTAASSGGGGGGAGGSVHWGFYPITTFTDTVGGTMQITVGSGGAGATVTTTDDTNGVAGAGGAGCICYAKLYNSSFARVTAPNSHGGGGGGTGGGNGGAGHELCNGVTSSSMENRGGNGAANANGLNAQLLPIGSVYGAGGGGGAGAEAAIVTKTGGVGGFHRTLNGPQMDVGGTGGTTGNGGDGADNSLDIMVAGSGGGGGRSISNATGGTGGNGGFPGGGGGGGGASVNGWSAGGGGNGAGGAVYLWEFSNPGV